MIELVFIGNELLSGFTVNTNASYLGQHLLAEGFVVSRQTVLPDERQALLKGLTEAMERSTLVIVSGGLGPTCDDITLSVAAELFDSDFYYHNEIGEELLQRYGTNYSDTLKQQATVPSKATILSNPIGSAPGCVFTSHTSTLVLLPGVPCEMQKMFQTNVVPLLHELYPENVKFTTTSFTLIRLNEADTQIFLTDLQTHYPNVFIGIYPGLGLLYLRLVSENPAALHTVEQKIRQQYHGHVFDSPTGEIVEAVHELLCSKQLTLSTAESCTGGHIAARLTEMAGASKYFLGSVVSYSNSMKKNPLGVSEDTLRTYGAVSEEVATEMAVSMLKITGSDFALAVSGIAGPTGETPEKPIGTVWCALAQQGKKPYTWLLKSHGTREMIINHSVNELLSELYLRIKSI